MSKMSSLISGIEFLAQTPAPGAPQGPAAWMQFLPMVLLFAAMYFLMIAPQRKKQKEHEKMLKSLETNGTSCGVPAEVVQQVRGSHAKAKQIGKQVCDAAARGPAPSGPTLSDALGTSPTLPSTTEKKGAGTFETMMGNPFQR